MLLVNANQVFATDRLPYGTSASARNSEPHFSRTCQLSGTGVSVSLPDSQRSRIGAFDDGGLSRLEVIGSPRVLCAGWRSERRLKSRTFEKVLDLERNTMFEKYSEKAGRAIFFSRREAGKFGATAIDTMHLLLGLLREDDERFTRLTGVLDLSNMVRARLHAPEKKEGEVSESVDIPIANEYKEVLLQAADEARLLNSASIEPQHFLLAILRIKACGAASILLNIGLTYEAVRKAIADEPQRERS